ncbi:hypothetical protein GY21_09495 [Cryobacterium roopkundense]|uniref:Uncharacterized protein n=1 Tax=Cryobacterium roopkundense TaxID=1001240 RepID=A0A099JBB6_9MICO|nr:hypothetical protein [Cryobacterium roopkundense]KGJ75674.1 hypothetical protein GY21_09495 [Cryobacterium roopkundense]MBB5641121.1 hypothetical protein [Cryobacterium roopkundense]
MVFHGDIRDALSGVVNLYFISTASSVTALIPIGGDIAAGINKTEKFISAADEISSGASLRFTLKDFGKSTSDERDLLRKVFMSPNNTRALPPGFKPAQVHLRSRLNGPSDPQLDGSFESLHTMNDRVPPAATKTPQL